MDTLQAYLPQAEGLLPKWLLLVRTPCISTKASRAYNKSQLTKPPGLNSIFRQQHPILHHPPLHLTRLQPHAHRPSPRHPQTRHSPLFPHIRYLDIPHSHGALLRRLQYKRPRVLSVGYVELCGGLGTLYE
jgi:hypothetical protein